MLQEMIKRLVFRMFPELSGGLHLPQWGRVEKVYTVEQAAQSTQFEPLYCIDIQPLNAQGKPNTKLPVFPKVPLPATGAGGSRGLYAYPKVGALVELGFIMGHPDKPFIRTILVEGATVPTLGTDDVLLSKDAGNYYRIDTGENITEHCQAIAQRVAKTRQRLKVQNGGKMWVGSESHNLLTLVSDLMGEVIAIADALAAHKHGGIYPGSGTTSTPNNASSYSSASSNTGTLKGNLDGFKE